MSELQIYLFYLVLILALSFLGFYFSAADSKMVNSLAAAAIGSGLSLILWQQYGRFMLSY